MAEHDFIMWLKGYIEAIGTELLKDDIHNIKEKLATVQSSKIFPTLYDPWGTYPYRTTGYITDSKIGKYGDSWFEPKPTPINEDIGCPWAVVTSTESFPLTEEST